jgi:RNA ligase
MQTLAELKEWVRRGSPYHPEEYGDVKAVQEGDLLLLNYTDSAQYANRWNWFERVCRGIVFNVKTGELVARPFDKFFNLGEHHKDLKGHIVTVTEKLDGSLGILIRDKGYRIVTRGSFSSKQAQWATEYLNTHYPSLENLPDSLTLLFEIVYPNNRIVVDYGKRESLVLLAARDRGSGKYLPFYPELFNLATTYGFELPKVYNFNCLEDIITAAGKLGTDFEGWVVEMSDGNRWKVKGDAYLELFRLIKFASYKQVAELVRDGKINEFIEKTPSHLISEIKTWKDDIEDKVSSAKADVELAFRFAPKGDRKSFALWVEDECPELAPYMFLRLDGKDYTALIFKRSFGIV